VPEEVERAARYVRAETRDRFVAARGTLRTLLARYLGVQPRQIVLSYGPRGKPRLVSPAGEVHFNVSHSGDLALIAFSSHSPIGVDLERISAATDVGGLAGRYFSPAELAHIEARSPAARRHAFFVCWTRKEAYLKATGDGLAQALDGFDVASAPGRVVPASPRVSEEALRWRLADLAPPRGYTAALALRQGADRAKIRSRWSEGG
jgi:4'-phosphopantetheinyl transferase